MAIKYEIKRIKRSKITSSSQEYVHLRTETALTDRQISAQIQDSCSLTEADLHASQTAIMRCLMNELMRGSSFHIAGVGYFYLSAKLNLPEGKSIDKVRADYISVRGIRFRPEAKLLSEIRQRARFERAAATPNPPEYTDEELLERICVYIAENGYIMRRHVETEFGLGRTEALKRLKRFAENGSLRKAGAKNSPIYLLPPET